VNICVGQLIYLLSNKDIKVYPAQVIEEINRKTLSGSETSYVIMLPDKNRSEVNISHIDAEIFTSSQEMEDKMFENAKLKIKSLIRSARELESIFEDIIVPDDTSEISIDNVEQSESKEIAEPTQKKRRRRSSSAKSKKDDKVVVDLGNGLTGKIDVSSINKLGVDNE
jgi:hypothetical protein